MALSAGTDKVVKTAMVKVVIVASGLLAWASTAVAALAGTPTPPMADAVVDYERPPPAYGKTSKEVLRQHAGRIRIDSRIEQPEGLVAERQEFTSLGQQAAFEVGRFADGRLAFLSVRDDPFRAPPPMTARAVAGRRETHLGEACQPWRVSTTIPHGIEFVQSGCATADGIELWRRQASIDAIFATKVTREPVAPADVRAPVELLNVLNWISASAPADHAKDFGVVLQPEGGVGRRVTVRRSGFWRGVAEDGRDWSSLVVTNPMEELRLVYSRNANGERQLNIGRRPFLAALNVEYSGVRVASRADEIIHGERCHWWDMMPGIEDAGRLECRTEDGAPLKIEYESWGNVLTVVASKLDRSPQPLSAVMPTEELMSGASWGF